MLKKIFVFVFVGLLTAGAVRAQEERPAEPKAKNAVWLIGDGMGPGAMGMFMQGVRLTDLAQYPDKQSVLEQFINASVSGVYFNNTHDTIVTDSAGAATQMAGGAYSRPDVIGLDFNGKRLETLLEKALKEGKSVGIISDAYVTDATPAGFLAHAKSRGEKYDIARQLVNSGAQVILGGGLKYFTQKENKKLLKEAKKQGWTVVQNAKELAKVKKGRVLGLFSEEAMPFYGDMERYPQVPTLKEMTQKAVELLSQNKNGFVLMVEAGKIDWALHDNEAGPSMWEMINLDETLGYLWDFARQSGDTLVYVNADHETGVPVFHYRHLDEDTVNHKSSQGEMLYGGNTDYVNYPYYQKVFAHKHLLYYVYPEFKKLPQEQQTAEKLQDMTDQALGGHIDLHLDGDVPDYEDLIERVNDELGLVWATGNHSSGMMLGVAYGPGAQEFAGVYHNTDLKGKFERALGF